MPRVYVFMYFLFSQVEYQKISDFSICESFVKMIAFCFIICTFCHRQGGMHNKTSFIGNTI